MPTLASPGQHSIFGEILDWMLAPLLLFWPMSIIATWLVAKSIANQPFDQALEHSLQSLSQQVTAGQLPAAALRALHLADELDQRYVQMRSAQGELLAGDAGLAAPSEEEGKPLSGVQFRNIRWQGQELRIAYTWLSNPGGAPILLQMGETMHQRARLTNNIIRGVILPQFIILPLALFLVWLALARGLAPLSLLQQTIRKREPEDVSPIITTHIPQEIAPLVQTLNHMLARLQHSVALQKRFVADAAHQMKTPLAGMQMQVELAQRDAQQQNLAEVGRSLQQLEHGAQQATRLINQLLALARVEEASHTLPRQVINLAELAREILADWVSLALAHKLDLGLELPENAAAANIDGQPILLREMINNLLDNALRYTPSGGIVTLRILVSQDQVVLEVEDNGPGIAAAERERVFERFYRILGNQAQGSGLGLAIVREIAHQHAATIQISEQISAQPASQLPGRPGCLLRLSFPSASE